MHSRYKQSYNRVAGLLAIGLLVAGIFAPKLYAQTTQPAPAGFNMTTSPVVANLETKPGVPTSTKIEVKNNNSTTEHIKVSLLKFTSNGTDGSPQLLDPSSNDEFLNWVTFSESTFDAEPNVWKSINVTVSPPSTAAFGYYYAVVFSRDNQQTAGAPTNLTAAVAVPMLLDVNAPGSVRKAEITAFSVSKNVYEFLPAKFSVTLKNSGNTHVAPRGNIFITQGSKSIATLEVNPGKGNILPNTSRTFGAQWDDGSPVFKIKEADGKVVLDKKGHPVTTLNWSNFDPSKIRIGKFHAKIAMVYDDGHGDVSVESSVDFWVIPWRIIAVFLVALVLIVAGLWALIIRPLRNRIKKRSAQKYTPKQN